MHRCMQYQLPFNFYRSKTYILNTFLYAISEYYCLRKRNWCCQGKILSFVLCTIHIGFLYAFLSEPQLICASFAESVIPHHVVLARQLLFVTRAPVNYCTTLLLSNNHSTSVVTGGYWLRLYSQLKSLVEIEQAVWAVKLPWRLYC